MKRRILLRLIAIVAWIHQRLYVWLGEETVMVRGADRQRAIREYRTDRVRPSREARVRTPRGDRKSLDIDSDLPHYESIPDEVTNE